MVNGNEVVITEDDLPDVLGLRGGSHNVNARRSRKSKSKSVRYGQNGGGASDFVGSFHAWQTDPASLSRYTEAHINNSPMFNPFNQTSVFATGTSGIIPTGQYYMTGGSRMTKCNSRVRKNSQKGGSSGNAWIDHVKRSMVKYGLSYRDALSDVRVRSSYHSKSNK